MTIYAINGSPRRNKNTATLLKSALKGVVSAKPEAHTELIHINDLDFKPCLSCFSCKRLGGSSYGKCAVNDPLTPLLEKLARADGIIFGSPIYFSGLTAKMRGLLERLLFPYLAYARDGVESLAPKRMPTAFIYTMNASGEAARELGYPLVLGHAEDAVGRIFTQPQTLYSYFTYQYDDYSRYKAELFSEPAKAMQRETQFPKDLEDAFEIGAALAAGPERAAALQGQET